jgi:hypothetical protein
LQSYPQHLESGDVTPSLCWRHSAAAKRRKNRKREDTELARNLESGDVIPLFIVSNGAGRQLNPLSNETRQETKKTTAWPLHIGHCSSLVMVCGPLCGGALFRVGRNDAGDIYHWVCLYDPNSGSVMEYYIAYAGMLAPTANDISSPYISGTHDMVAMRVLPSFEYVPGGNSESF